MRSVFVYLVLENLAADGHAYDSDMSKLKAETNLRHSAELS